MSSCLVLGSRSVRQFIVNTSKEFLLSCDYLDPTNFLARFLSRSLIAVLDRETSVLVVRHRPTRFLGAMLMSVVDYPEVDPNIAAEVMFHQAQAMQRGPPAGSFPPNPAFGIPMQPMPVPPPGLPAMSHPPNFANVISTLDGPSLQSLLSALQQRPAPSSQPVSATQSPFASPNPPPPADLASLLTNASRPAPMPANQHPHLPHPAFNLQPPNGPVVSDPNLLSLLAKGLGGQQPQAQPVGSNVQNLMDHLAKWKQ